MKLWQTSFLLLTGLILAGSLWAILPADRLTAAPLAQGTRPPLSGTQTALAALTPPTSPPGGNTPSGPAGTPASPTWTPTATPTNTRYVPRYTRTPTSTVTDTATATEDANATALVVAETKVAVAETMAAAAETVAAAAETRAAATLGAVQPGDVHAQATAQAAVATAVAAETRIANLLSLATPSTEPPFAPTALLNQASAALILLLCLLSLAGLMGLAWFWRRRYPTRGRPFRGALHPRRGGSAGGEAASSSTPLD